MHEEKTVRGAGLMAPDEADFCFDALRRNRQTEQEAVTEAAAVQEEAALTAALAAAEREAVYEATHGPGSVARSRDRARAGWDRVRIAVTELSWRRFRRVFRKKRSAIVEGPVLTVELVGTVLWMAWERWRVNGA